MALDLCHRCTPDLREQPRCRYRIDCAGAQLDVHARSLATVLHFDGEIDASNADLLAQAIRRFSQLKAPLIIDLSSRVVTDHGFAIVDSVPEALQLIEDAINARRQFVSGQARQQEPQRKTPTTRVFGIRS